MCLRNISNYPSDYDAAGNPQHFYWSMQKNGATIASNVPTHRSITFTAPTVTQTTQWKLYSYVANNKGKANEVYITITVNPAVAPTPTAPTIQTANLQVTGQGTNSISLQWQRGNGQSCILVGEEVGANAMDAPQTNTVYSGNSNLTTAPSVFSGSDTKVLYTGTGNSLTVAGLDANTTYRFAVYEYNGTTAANVRYLVANPAYGIGATARIQLPATTVTMTWNPSMPFTENTTVNFTGLATNYTSLTWSVTGNATILSGQGTLNATIRMSNAGNCSVSLTAFNSATGLSDRANLYTQVMTTTQILPDLVISSASVSGAVQNNVPFNLNITQNNNGADYPNNFSSWTKFYISTDNILDFSDTYFNGNDYSVTNSIPMNSFISFSKTLTIPVGIGTGSYYILIQADGGINISEANENNNTYAFPISVVASPSDLIVQSFSITPTTLAAGTSFTANAVVQNIGTGGASLATGGPYIQLYYSTDNILDVNDLELGLMMSGATQIYPNSTSSYTDNLTIPNTLANGSYYIFAAVDYAFPLSSYFNYNIESNENNNIASVLITINSVGQPTVPTSNCSITNVTANSLDFSWTSGNGNGRTVIAKAGDIPMTPNDNSTYTPNNNITLAPGLTNGTNGSTHKVVYSGSGNNMTLTGLSTNQDYILTALEYSNPGPNYLHNFGNAIAHNSTNIAYAYIGNTNSNGWQKLTGFCSQYGWYENNILFFVNNQIGYYVYGSYVCKTINGGSTWTGKQVSANQLNAIWFTSANTGWAAGSKGFIAKTTNGGSTWSVQNSGINSNYEVVTDLYFLNANEGYAVVCDNTNHTGKVIKTTNGGGSWNVVFNCNYELVAITAFSNSTIWVAGSNRKIYKSINSGISWTEISPSSGYNWSFIEIQFIDNNNGWAVQEPHTINGNTMIYKTNDGGTTWTTSMITAYGLNDIHFTNSQNGYAIGNTWLATTNDGGNSWTVNTNIGGYKLFCLSNNEIYLTGSSNYWGLWKSTTGGQSQTAVLAPLSNTSYCQGSALSSAYTLVGSFNSGNVFTLELSDATGSFVSPTELATATSTTQGNLSGAIPANISAGTGYRVRVRSTNPVSISAESAVFSITTPPSVSITNLANSYLSTATPFNLTATPVGGIFKVNGVTATQFNPSALGGGTHTVTYEVTQGSCSASARQIVTVSVPMSATTTVANSSLCAGSTLNVNYNVSGVFDANNVFTVELSNETGSFTTPTVIGTFSNSGANTLACVLPQGLIAGNQYRVRIVAAAPAFVGVNSGVFTIQAAPLVSVGLNVSPSNIICNNDAVTFTATPTNGGTTPQYQWKLNGANVGTNIFRYQNSTLSDGDVVYVEMISNAVCAGTTPSVSMPVSMQVTTVPKPQIFAIDSTLASSATTGNQWYRNGVAIQGATGQFYTTNVRGFYTVTVLQNGCSNMSDIFQHNPTTSTKEEMDIKSNISIFPNPTFGQVTLEFKDLPLDHAEIRIFNTLGQFLYKKEIISEQTTLDFSGLATGLYYLKVKTSKGETVKKVMVQR